MKMKIKNKKKKINNKRIYKLMNKNNNVWKFKMKSMFKVKIVGK